MPESMEEFSVVDVVMPILIEHSWQIPMTKCAIDTMRCTTDVPFRLIIVETLSDHFVNDCNTHLMRTAREGATKDINYGLELVTTNRVVYTGNDVFVRPGWLEAHLEVWDRFPDCGASTLASADLKGMPGKQADFIGEGIYGPHMMFESKYRFDEKIFPANFADTDLITRIYRDGKRMYRNHKVVIEHLNQQTMGHGDFDTARQAYIDKHKDFPTLVFRALVEGWVV